MTKPPTPTLPMNPTGDKACPTTSPIYRRLRTFLVIGAVLPMGWLIVTWPRPIVWLNVLAANRSVDRRDYERAVDWLEHAVDWNPQDGEAQFRLARCYRHLGNMERVRRHLGQALRNGYSTRSIEREEWLAQAQSGQLREVERHLPGLLQDSENDGAEICEAYVNGFFLATRFREALDLLDVWQKAFPLDAQPYLFRGRFLEVQSDTKEAADAYREGLKRESSRRDLQVSLARCLISLHDHSAATEILNRLESQAPDDPEVLQNLALGLVQQGELDEATRVLSRLLAVEPKNAVGRLTLGRIHLQNKRHDQAQELLGELAAERPYDIEVRYSNAQALLATGKKEQAAKEFQFVTTARESIGSVRRMMDHVSQKDPMNYELRYQIGASLLRYESPSAGAGWLRSVLEINPNHSPTHEALADYYTQTENTELARFHRDRLRELSTSVTTPPGPTAHQ